MFEKSCWGYYSLGLVGYEVKINDDGDSVTWIYTGDNDQKTHKAKIQYTKGGNPYFRAGCRRIHLSQVIRTNI